ncbi:dihydrodipicolinate synthase family protein [Sphingomonas sp. YL-JM2C]
MANRRPLLTASDVQGAWVIIPTPAKPGADHWSATDTVDVDETARVADALIAAGADAIMSMGTLGECATLTWPEKQRFISTLVETVAGRVPVFVGTSTLNTRDTVEQTRWARDVGADGTMVGPPMWCAPSIPTVVQFYRDLAEACPDMAIAIYANHEAFKFEFSLGFWAQVADISQIVTAKLPPVAQLLAYIGVTGGRIRFLPIENDYYAAARSAPEFFSGFWTSSACCGPEASIALRDRVARAKVDGDWASAGRLTAAMGQAIAPIFPNGSFKEFSTYNIALEKERMNVAGFMNAGPVRAPYSIVPQPFLEGAQKSGLAWAKICEDVRNGAI